MQKQSIYIYDFVLGSTLSFDILLWLLIHINCASHFFFRPVESVKYVPLHPHYTPVTCLLYMNQIRIKIRRLIEMRGKSS